MKSAPSTPDSLSWTERARGAVWGQFVGDAAGLGTHWIYKLDDLDAAFPDGVHGFEAPGREHYHAGRHSGQPTHYGDGALVLLQSVAAKGSLDVIDYGERFVSRFGARSYDGYLDKATRQTLANVARWKKVFPGKPIAYQNGADDDQLATATRLAPVIVAHQRDDDLLFRVECCTRVCQNNGRAVIYMRAHALLIKALLEGLHPVEAVRTVLNQLETLGVAGREAADALQKAQAAAEEEVEKATLKLGQACPLAESFPAAVQALLHHPDQFQTAILATIRVGGDNAGRAAMLGAWLGAHLGLDGIPEAWRSRLVERAKIEKAVDALLKKL